MDEATSNSLDDVSPANSPDPATPNDPEIKYRAHVVKATKFTPTPSKWKVNEEVFYRKDGGQPLGPFWVTECHEPQREGDKWRYDLKDRNGKVKQNISGKYLY